MRPRGILLAAACYTPLVEECKGATFVALCKMLEGDRRLILKLHLIKYADWIQLAGSCKHGNKSTVVWYCRPALNGGVRQKETCDIPASKRKYLFIGDTVKHFKRVFRLK
jgi:hypothetical protein